MTLMLDASQFLEMIIAGKDLLKDNISTINALNELPIPDHDTGTNMFHTMEFALNDLFLENDIGDLALRISIRISTSAEGKSGEVLARFFGGFVEPLEYKSHLDAQLLKCSFQNALASLNMHHQLYANCIPHIIQMIEIMTNTAERLLEGLIRECLLEAMMYRIITDAQEHVKQNNITDAGCIGLLHVVEGMYVYLRNISLL